MILSKNKSLRLLLHREILKQQSKREQTHPVCLHAVEKYEKVESINTQNDCKQQVKNEQIKRKQTCSICFVNVFKFQENKFKIIQKNFWEIKIILIKKTFLEKATGHNDHDMINMGRDWW